MLRDGRLQKNREKITKYIYLASVNFCEENRNLFCFSLLSTFIQDHSLLIESHKINKIVMLRWLTPSVPTGSPTLPCSPTAPGFPFSPYGK